MNKKVFQAFILKQQLKNDENFSLFDYVKQAAEYGIIFDHVLFSEEMGEELDKIFSLTFMKTYFENLCGYHNGFDSKKDDAQLDKLIVAYGLKPAVDRILMMEKEKSIQKMIPGFKMQYPRTY